jgi:biotin transport system substrate-specific component
MPTRTESATAAAVGPWSLTTRRAVAIGVGALLVALAARVARPVPGSPIPLTLQDVTVLALGGVLGPVAGTGALLAYLGLGAAGLPVFAAGGTVAYLLGPTGGYLLAFPLAAWAVGVVTRPVTPLRALVGALMGMIVIHAGGVSWLALQTGDAAAAIRLGSLPFLATGLVKVGLATGIVLALARRTRPAL